MNTRFVRLLALAGALFVSSLQAAPTAPPPAVAACIRQAAETFGMSELPLQVLYAMERGRVGAVSRNTNGTVDIGPMQINSSWLPKLRPAGITYERLRDETCTNVFVGAWIFVQEWQRTQNVAQAIAHYHSPTAKFQARYLARVSAHLKALIAAEQARLAAPSTPTPPRRTPLPGPALVAGAPQ